MYKEKYNTVCSSFTLAPIHIHSSHLCEHDSYFQHTLITLYNLCFNMGGDCQSSSQHTYIMHVQIVWVEIFKGGGYFHVFFGGGGGVVCYSPREKEKKKKPVTSHPQKSQPSNITNLTVHTHRHTPSPNDSLTSSPLLVDSLSQTHWWLKQWTCCELSCWTCSTCKRGKAQL